MSRTLDTIAGKLSEEKKLGIACASLMTRQCGGCAQSLKVRLHREPDPKSDTCMACIRAEYSAMWKEDCTCIK